MRWLRGFTNAKGNYKALPLAIHALTVQTYRVIRRILTLVRWSVLAWDGLFAAASNTAKAGESLLSPDQIIQKAIERSAADNTLHARTNYVYDKQTVRENLDGKGG